MSHEPTSSPQEDADTILKSCEDMDQLKAFASLKDRARNPPDLTDPEVLTADRFSTFRATAGAWDYFFATQRVDQGVLDLLQQLADEAGVVAQFEAKCSGAVLNRILGYESEDRAVLHTACRDVFDHGADVVSASRRTAIAESREQLEELKTFLEGIEDSRFTDLVQIGIGGSDLGPRAIWLCLQALGLPGRKVHFFSNVDPDDAAEVLEGLDLSRTLVAVVSKSGTTLETRTNETLARKLFEERGLDPKEHFLAVTGKGSPMDNPDRYLKSFYMYGYIGGRYSVSSMVGGVALGFGLGYEQFLDFLRGANEMDRNAREPKIRENLSLLSALLGIWNRNFLGSDTLAVLPYSQAMNRMVAHFQQLDMESNGKRINRRGEVLKYRTGPIVWGEPGTNGQHAFYQLIHQSEMIIPSEFIGFRKNQRDLDVTVEGTTSQEKLLSNLLAQSIALATGKADENPNKVFPGNRPSSILMADRATPRAVGELLALFENRTAFQGFLWNINSFDQEGVQLGKVLADRILKHFKGLRDDPEFDGEETDPLGWALLKASKVGG